MPGGGTSGLAAVVRDLAARAKVNYYNVIYGPQELQHHFRTNAAGAVARIVT